MPLLLLVIFIFLLYIYFFRTIESFTVPSNAFDIPSINIDGNKDNLNNLNYIFKKYSVIDKNTIDLSQFTDTPYYIDKNDTNNLNKLLSDTLPTILENIGVSAKLDFVKNYYNLRWRILNGLHYLIFNIDLINDSQFFVQPLFVYLKVDLLRKNPKSFQLLYIEIDQSIAVNEFNINGYDYNKSDTYYRIKNHLYLFDPYLTSGKEMEIKSVNRT